MEYEAFVTYADSLLRGLYNRINEGDDEAELRRRYNELSGTLMSMYAEHYNTNETNQDK